MPLSSPRELPRRAQASPINEGAYVSYLIDSAKAQPFTGFAELTKNNG
jgi:hypothetical protein